MTAFIATLCESFAVLTTDTESIHMVTGEIGRVRKIEIDPYRRVIMTGAGPAGCIGHWFALLNDGEFLPPGDIEDIGDFAPAAMRAAWRDYAERERDNFPPGLVDRMAMARVVHIGIDAAGRPLGFAHEYPEFEARRIEPGAGHTMMPPAHPDGPEYDSLSVMCAGALNGQNVEGFHLAFIKNAAWQSRAGRIPALADGLKTHVGGPTLIVRIDAEGYGVSFVDGPQTRYERFRWPGSKQAPRSRNAKRQC